MSAASARLLRIPLQFAGGIVVLVSCVTVFAEKSADVKLGKIATSRWRFGVEVTAEGGPVTGIVATLPVPMDWPEQKVKIVEEDISPRAKVSYRVVDGAVKQMLVNIPKLADG